MAFLLKLLEQIVQAAAYRSPGGAAAEKPAQSTTEQIAETTAV
jgi:hypothetical protein